MVQFGDAGLRPWLYPSLRACPLLELRHLRLKELHGLGLDIEVLDDKDNPISLEKLVEDKLSMIR
jgi:hypothetical protein